MDTTAIVNDVWGILVQDGQVTRYADVSPVKTAETETETVVGFVVSTGGHRIKVESDDNTVRVTVMMASWTIEEQVVFTNPSQAQIVAATVSAMVEVY